MSTDKKTVLENARKDIDKACGATRLIHKIPESVFPLCRWVTLSASDHKLTFATNHYGDTLMVLSELRRVFDEPLPLTTHFGYGSKIHFYWENKHMQVTFSCKHDAVPAALMPSEGCTVERVDKVETKYAIVCPSNGG